MGVEDMFGLEREHTLAIGVVGLGLIGGSLAKALKRYTRHLVYGCDIDGETLDAAFECDAIDEKIVENDLSECDLVFVALYPRQTVDFVKNNIRSLKEGAIVMDLCGVKRYVVDQLTPLCAENKVLFIGGHPMAGRECWGFSSADAELFRGASMIITPDGTIPQPTLNLLTGIFADIGFSNLNMSSTDAHDEMIAFTSQLAHVVSSAYVKSPCAQRHGGFSAGSYKDLTRVARLNVPMWAELFLENADHLVGEIDGIIARLGAYRDAISDDNEARLCALLEDGKSIKEALDS